MNNLGTLRRLFAVPWAMRELELSLFPQLLMGGGSTSNVQRPTSNVQGLHAGDGKGLRPMDATSWKLPHYDELTGEFKRDFYPTQKGYEVLNFEGLIGSLRGTLPEVPEGVTVLLVWGMLGRGWTSEDRYWLDPIEYDEIVQTLMRVPANHKVVLWFRSPGGLHTGVTETALWLRQFASVRDVEAFTDDVMASAAVNLGFQCPRVVATTSAAVGSIGVYIAFYDFCEYMKKAGVELHLWKAGEEKGDGMQGNPVSKKMDERKQREVSDAYAEFVESVTAMRAIDSSTMQGQCFYGEEARAVNLVDELVGSAAEYFSRLV